MSLNVSTNIMKSDAAMQCWKCKSSQLIGDVEDRRLSILSVVDDNSLVFLKWYEYVEFLQHEKHELL